LTMKHLVNKLYKKKSHVNLSYYKPQLQARQELYKKSISVSNLT